MPDATFEKLLQTFFVCDKAEVLRIFSELLNAMEAEEMLPPSSVMSGNYDTAQANPEIHTLPGNLKDARDAIFPFFWATDGWYSKLHLENVKGPANYASLIGAISCLLKNPNLCVDTYSLRSNELEIKAITALANLLFYHTDSPWGFFTMGGTISNMYGGKIGIEKVCPQAMHKGLAGQPNVAGLVSEAGHYSNHTLAGWLGIGTNNLHSIPVDRSCAMRLDLLAAKLDELYQANTRVAFVVATFGSTDAFGVDDLIGIRAIIEEKAAKYGMPVPHLHTDAAVGWILCFFNEFNAQNTPFKFNPEALPLIEAVGKQARKLLAVDSITIDFHKMGWGHYPSSAFIVNRRDDLKYLSRTKEDIPYFSEADYSHDPALFTLECSRPAIGPYSVMASLNGIGLTGYQKLLAHAMEMCAYAKQRLEALEYCVVLNSGCIGPSVVWWVLPKGRQAKNIFEQLEQGKLPQADIERFFAETKRLFEKRKLAMDPKKDARLSFTNAIGYAPHDIAIPAWKAVFYNPKTDKQVVDDLIQSIEDL